LTDSSNKKRRWWHEIRQRGVIHVASLYIVAAWLVVQLVGMLAEGPFPMPSEAQRAIWVALIVIFPVVLVFGWRYDITRDGVVVTVPRDGEKEERPLRREDFAIIGGLSLIIVGILGFATFEVVEAIEHDRLRAGIGVQTANGPAPPNSIAVMPFAVCSGAERDSVLAVGLAAEIIDRLAGVGTFKVIARASSFTMAGFSLSLTQVARPLAVQYVLTGELCRDGETLTLRVELVDADGYVVWSERYDQAGDQAGDMMVPLAARVTQGVAEELGHAFPSSNGTPINRLANEHLVIGREYAHRGETEPARAAFEKALTYQPDYADAVFALALLDKKEVGHLKERVGIEKAWPRGQRALELVDVRLADNGADFLAHLAAGEILYTLSRWDENLLWREAAGLDEDEVAEREAAILGRLVEAENHIRAALARNGSDTDVYHLLALTLERQGVARRNEALEVLEAGLDNDPFNARLNIDVAKRLASRGRYREGIELLERFEELPQRPAAAWWGQLEIMKLQTYWDEKCRVMIDLLLNDPEALENVGNYGHLVWVPSELAFLGLRDEAEAWFRRVEPLPAEGWAAVLRGWFIDQYFGAMGEPPPDKEDHAAKSDEEILGAFYAEAWHMAWTIADAGDSERGLRLMESIGLAPGWGTFWSEREMTHRLQLAQLYHKVGRPGDAVQVLSEAVRHLEDEYEIGIRDPQTLANLAGAYALQGRDDDALDMLRRAVDYHWRGTVLYDDLELYSPWGRLRDDPRFVAELDRMQADLDQQANRIRSMLGQYDIDSLMAGAESVLGTVAATASAE